MKTVREVLNELRNLTNEEMKKKVRKIIIEKSFADFDLPATKEDIEFLVLNEEINRLEGEK